MVVNLVSRRVHLVDGLAEIVCGRDAFRMVLGVLAMAIAAQAAGGGRQHRVVRFLDRMFAMALAALGPVMFVEGLLVFAAVKETRIGRVTKTATATHARHPRRAGGVVAVTIVAGGCAQIAALQQGAAVHAVFVLRELIGRQRRAVREGKAGHGLGIGVTGAAGLRHTLRINLRLRILRRANAVDAMAAHALRSAVVMFHEQQLAVGAVLEFGQLIGRQPRIELVHESRIGMTARAKLDDPGAILVAALLGPFFDELVPDVGGWIATMTTGTGEAAAEMNVLDHVLETQVRRRVLRGGREGEEVFRRLNFGISVAQDAIVLQDELHLLRPQLECQERPEVLRLCDDLFLHRLGEVFLQVIVEAVEISSLFLRDDRLAALIFGIEQRGQLGRDAGRGLVCRQGSGGNEDGAKDNEGVLTLCLPR